jgi:probable F420-dependent oxidoreductase
MKVDGMLGGGFDGVAEQARRLEADGYDGGVTAEMGHDPFFPLVLAAQATERLEVATGVAIAFARTPMTLAMIANDVQLAAKGRFSLGIGSQIKPHIERRFSMPWSHPAARMREFVLAMRAIWASWNGGTRLDFTGDFYTHTLMTPVFAPPPHEFGAPRVFLAAVGPRMTEVAGEVADGVITHGVSSARYLREVTLPALERVLERSGRTRADVDVTCPGFIAVADAEERIAKARAAMRRHLSYYASTPAYRPVLELHGWGDLQTELYACSKQGRWDAMAELVDDDVLDTCTIIATPDPVAAEVRARYGGLVDRITVSWWRKDWWPPVADELRAL